GGPTAFYGSFERKCDWVGQGQPFFKVPRAEINYQLPDIDYTTVACLSPQFERLAYDNCLRKHAHRRRECLLRGWLEELEEEVRSRSITNHIPVFHPGIIKD